MTDVITLLVRFKSYAEIHADTRTSISTSLDGWSENFKTHGKLKGQIARHAVLASYLLKCESAFLDKANILDILDMSRGEREIDNSFGSVEEELTALLLRMKYPLSDSKKETVQFIDNSLKDISLISPFSDRLSRLIVLGSYMQGTNSEILENENILKCLKIPKEIIKNKRAFHTYLLDANLIGFKTPEVRVFTAGKQSSGKTSISICLSPNQCNISENVLDDDRKLFVEETKVMKLHRVCLPKTNKKLKLLENGGYDYVRRFKIYTTSIQARDNNNGIDINIFDIGGHVEYSLITSCLMDGSPAFLLTFNGAVYKDDKDTYYEHVGTLIDAILDRCVSAVFILIANKMDHGKKYKLSEGKVKTQLITWATEQINNRAKILQLASQHKPSIIDEVFEACCLPPDCLPSDCIRLDDFIMCLNLCCPSSPESDEIESSDKCISCCPSKDEQIISSTKNENSDKLASCVSCCKDTVKRLSDLAAVLPSIWLNDGQSQSVIANVDPIFPNLWHEFTEVLKELQVGKAEQRKWISDQLKDRLRYVDFRREPYLKDIFDRLRMHLKKNKDASTDEQDELEWMAMQLRVTLEGSRHEEGAAAVDDDYFDKVMTELHRSGNIIHFAQENRDRHVEEVVAERGEDEVEDARHEEKLSNFIFPDIQTLINTLRVVFRHDLEKHMTSDDFGVLDQYDKDDRIQWFKDGKFPASAIKTLFDDNVTSDIYIYNQKMFETLVTDLNVAYVFTPDAMKPDDTIWFIPSVVSNPVKITKKLYTHHWVKNLSKDNDKVSAGIVERVLIKMINDRLIKHDNITTVSKKSTEDRAKGVVFQLEGTISARPGLKPDQLGRALDFMLTEEENATEQCRRGINVYLGSCEEFEKDYIKESFEKSINSYLNRNENEQVKLKDCSKPRCSEICAVNAGSNMDIATKEMDSLDYAITFIKFLLSLAGAISAFGLCYTLGKESTRNDGKTWMVPLWLALLIVVYCPAVLNFILMCKSFSWWFSVVHLIFSPFMKSLTSLCSLFGGVENKENFLNTLITRNKCCGKETERFTTNERKKKYEVFLVYTSVNYGIGSAMKMIFNIFMYSNGVMPLPWDKTITIYDSEGNSLSIKWAAVSLVTSILSLLWSVFDHWKSYPPRDIGSKWKKHFTSKEINKAHLLNPELEEEAARGNTLPYIKQFFCTFLFVLWLSLFRIFCLSIIIIYDGWWWLIIPALLMFPSCAYLGFLWLYKKLKGDDYKKMRWQISIYKGKDFVWLLCLMFPIPLPVFSNRSTHIWMFLHTFTTNSLLTLVLYRVVYVNQVYSDNYSPLIIIPGWMFVSAISTCAVLMVLTTLWHLFLTWSHTYRSMFPICGIILREGNEENRSCCSLYKPVSQNEGEGHQLMELGWTLDWDVERLIQPNSGNTAQNEDNGGSPVKKMYEKARCDCTKLMQFLIGIMTVAVAVGLVVYASHVDIEDRSNFNLTTAEMYNMTTMTPHYINTTTL